MPIISEYRIKAAQVKPGILINYKSFISHFIIYRASYANQ